MKSRRSFIGLSTSAAVGAIGGAGSLNAQQAEGNSQLAISFFGAAGRVSGSMFLVSLSDEKLLIDCGSFYDEGGSGADLNAEIPREVLDARMLLLTHAHTDHVGRLALLIQRGFKGTIAGTDPTLNLLKVMLVMGARYSSDPLRQWVWSSRQKAIPGRIDVHRLHWHPKCQWAKEIHSDNQRTARGSWASLDEMIQKDHKAEASPCKVCAELEIDPVMNRCKSFVVGKPFRIGEKITATAIEAGHLPGSVSFHLQAVTSKGSTRSVLFSGDLGTSAPILQQPGGKPPTADAIVVECTYGTSRPSTNRTEGLENFRRSLIAHLKRGSVVWIPCFALDRTEKILMQIELALRASAGELGRVPEVFVPSPSANDFHDLYRKGAESWGLRQEYLALDGRARKGGPRGFKSHLPDEVQRFLDALKASEMELAGFPEPSTLQAEALRSLQGNIVLTTSGMISEAFSRELFVPLARTDMSAIFLVGYQDPKSTGGMLQTAAKEGRRFVEIDGDKIEVSASIEEFHEFTGHANAAEIDSWLDHQKREVPIFLVHGEPAKLQDRKSDLLGLGWKSVSIPTHQQKIIL
jgi:metallo-beta-lactamase family protein